MDIARKQCMKGFKDGDFSILSWNILADIYLDFQINDGNADYTHVTPSEADWINGCAVPQFRPYFSPFFLIESLLSGTMRCHVGRESVSHHTFEGSAV